MSSESHNIDGDFSIDDEIGKHATGNPDHHDGEVSRRKDKIDALKKSKKEMEARLLISKQSSNLSPQQPTISEPDNTEAASRAQSPLLLPDCQTESELLFLADSSIPSWADSDEFQSHNNKESEDVLHEEPTSESEERANNALRILAAATLFEIGSNLTTRVDHFKNCHEIGEHSSVSSVPSEVDSPAAALESQDTPEVETLRQIPTTVTDSPNVSQEGCRSEEKHDGARSEPSSAAGPVEIQKAKVVPTLRAMSQIQSTIKTNQNRAQLLDTQNKSDDGNHTTQNGHSSMHSVLSLLVEPITPSEPESPAVVDTNSLSQTQLPAHDESVDPAFASRISQSARDTRGRNWETKGDEFTLFPIVEPIITACEPEDFANRTSGGMAHSPPHSNHLASDDEPTLLTVHSTNDTGKGGNCGSMQLERPLEVEGANLLNVEEQARSNNETKCEEASSNVLVGVDTVPPLLSEFKTVVEATESCTEENHTNNITDNESNHNNMSHRMIDPVKLTKLEAMVVSAQPTSSAPTFSVAKATEESILEEKQRIAGFRGQERKRAPLAPSPVPAPMRTEFQNSAADGPFEYENQAGDVADLAVDKKTMSPWAQLFVFQTQNNSHRKNYFNQARSVEGKRKRDGTRSKTRSGRHSSDYSTTSKDSMIEGKRSIAGFSERRRKRLQSPLRDPLAPPIFPKSPMVPNVQSREGWTMVKECHKQRYSNKRSKAKSKLGDREQPSIRTMGDEEKASFLDEVVESDEESPRPGAYRSDGQKMPSKGVLTRMLEGSHDLGPEARSVCSAGAMSSKSLSNHDSSAQDPPIFSAPCETLTEKEASAYVAPGKQKYVLFCCLILSLAATGLGVGLGIEFNRRGWHGDKDSDGMDVPEQDGSPPCVANFMDFYNNCKGLNSSKQFCSMLTPEYLELKELFAPHLSNTTCDASNLALFALSKSALTSSNLSLVDMFAAATLFISTFGPLTWKTHGFNLDTPCEWASVDCACDAALACRVKRIDLSSTGLTGTIPSQIGLLSSLEVLSFDLNEIRGTLPSEMGALTGLRRFSINSNTMAGTVPTEVGLLTNLEAMILRDAGLRGTIPSEMGNMESLGGLAIDGNSFTGELPDEFFQLVGLEELYMGDNSFGGSLSPFVGRLNEIRVLDAKANRFTGALPTEVQSLTNLRFLDLSRNPFFRASIPDLSALTNLVSMHFSSMRLTGTLPDSLFLLPRLTTLELQKNRLESGTIPSSIGGLLNLEELNLSGNGLEGPIPTEIGLLRNLRRLLLGSNKLTGPLPSSVGQLEKLEVMDFGNNKLEGSIPSDVCRLWNYSLTSMGDGQPTSCPDLAGWLGGLSCTSFDCCRVCEDSFQ